MRVDLGVYAGLMVVGLGAAYWASLPVEEGEAERVALAAFEPGSIAAMTFHSKETDVTAQRRPDKKFWVDFHKLESLNPPPPHEAIGSGSGSAVAAVPPVLPPVETKERFLGNEKMDQLAQSFNPLSALRVIGPVGDEKQMEEFGLKDKTDYFVLTTDAGKSFKLLLGKRSYGTKNRFAMEEGGNRVLLLDDEGFDNLEKANLRAYDRRLYDFEMSEVTAAAIKVGGKEKRMAHTQRDKSGEPIWTDDEDKAPPKAQYDAWMDRVSKLRLSGYATEEELKQAASAPPFLEISFEGKAGVRDTVIFRKVMQGDKPAYFVTSNFLKTQGKLVTSRVDPVEKDLGAIMGGGAAGG